MFARVSIIEGSPARTDESIRFMRETVLPEARKMPGFKGLYLLVDRKTGKEMTIAMWKSEAELKASSGAASRLRAQAIEKVAAPPAKVEIYEVALQP